VRVSSGINVLDNKTELRKEMDKRKQRQQRREDDQREKQNRTSFDLRLEQQANKLDVVIADYTHIYNIFVESNIVKMFCVLLIFCVVLCPSVFTYN